MVKGKEVKNSICRFWITHSGLSGEYWRSCHMLTRAFISDSPGGLDNNIPPLAQMTAPASISVTSEESNFKFKFQSLILVLSAILNVDQKKTNRRLLQMCSKHWSNWGEEGSCPYRNKNNTIDLVFPLILKLKMAALHPTPIHNYNRGQFVSIIICSCCR